MLVGLTGETQVVTVQCLCAVSFLSSEILSPPGTHSVFSSLLSRKKIGSRKGEKENKSEIEGK